MKTIGRIVAVALSVDCAARALSPAGIPPQPLSPAAALAEGGDVPLPAWLPEDALFAGALGRTNLLSVEARWVFGPVAGRPAYLWLSYSNRTVHAYDLERAFGDYRRRRGVLAFALETGGDRRVLPGLPECAGMLSPGALFRPAAVDAVAMPLPADFSVAAGGAEGVVLAYVGHEEPYLFWAVSPPLAAPAASPEPATAGTNEWTQLLAFWTANGLEYPVRPYEILEEFPEFAPYFPGVVLDATLPEAFRVAFANRMPTVDVWDPAVFAFVTNAVDKTAPLVSAAVNVFLRQNPAQEAGGEEWDAAAVQFRAMAADPNLPRSFRLRLFRGFTKPPWYAAFVAQTDPHFRLTAAYAMRTHRALLYGLDRRDTIRQGQQALTGDGSNFDASGTDDAALAGKTVGEVASLLLAEFEAKWAAEPPRQP